MTIQDMLMAWGRGRAMDCPDNGYPPQSTFARFIRSTGQANVSVPPLPEDQFTLIDVEVSRMRDRKPEHHKVICLYYVERMSDVRVGKFLRMSRHKAKSLRENAEHYLEAKIEKTQ